MFYYDAVLKPSFLYGLSADSEDEEILELDDLQAPEPLKVKSYSEASSELNHVSNFFLRKVNHI